MTLRKIIIVKTVNYIPQSEQIQSISKDRDSKPKTIKNNSLSRGQDKNLSQDKKKLIEKRSGRRIWYP